MVRSISAKLYRQMVEDSLGLICLHDLDGVLLYVNPAAANALGYESHEWVGRNLREFLAPHARPLFDEYLVRVRRKSLDSGLLCLVAKTGEERIWTYRNICYERAGQPSYVIGHAQDITEHLRVEQTLRNRDKRFRALIEHTEDMIVLLDAEGAVRYESPSTARILGYTFGESLGVSGFELVHPEDRSSITDAFTRLAQHPETIRQREVRVRSQDGSWRVLEVIMTNLLTDPAVESIVINARDITHRKQAEEELRRYAERLNALNKIARSILAVDSPQAIAQTALRYIPTFTSCPQASILAFDAKLSQATVLATLNSAETQLREGRQFPLQNLNGSARLLQGELHHIPDIQALAHRTAIEEILGIEGVRSYITIPLIAQGELIGALYLLSDTSNAFHSAEIETVKEVANLVAIALQQSRLHEGVRQHAEHLEQEVRKRTAELHERETLAATGRMAARIAHEINNPLASIQNAFLLIKDAVPADHPYYDYVGRIDKEIDRLAQIIRQMFDLYQPGQKAPEQFCLNQVITDVVALTELSCRQQGITIQTKLPPSPILVVLPEGAVRQVLFNILMNAVEASSPESGVEVAVEVCDTFVVIEIADQGYGIPPGTQPQIFEPFFTTKTGIPRRGLGLGLPTSKNLLETMGGSIEFRSREPRPGTIFAVTLPRNR